MTSSAVNLSRWLGGRAVVGRWGPLEVDALPGFRLDKDEDNLQTKRTP